MRTAEDYIPLDEEDGRRSAVRSPSLKTTRCPFRICRRVRLAGPCHSRHHSPAQDSIPERSHGISQASDPESSALLRLLGGDGGVGKSLARPRRDVAAATCDSMMSIWIGRWAIPRRGFDAGT